MTYTTRAAVAAGPQAVVVMPAPAHVRAPQSPARATPAAPAPTAAPLPPPRQHPLFQAPANEAERLEALHLLQILDTEPEARFDDITRIVKAVFKVQFAAITLVDKGQALVRLSRGLLAACLWRSEAGRQAQALLRVGAICCLPVCGWPGRLRVAQGGQGARADPAGCLFVAGLAGPLVSQWLSKLGWLMMPGCLEGQGRANFADGLLWQRSVLPEQAVRGAPLLVVFDLHYRQRVSGGVQAGMSSTKVLPVSMINGLLQVQVHHRLGSQADGQVGRLLCGRHPARQAGGAGGGGCASRCQVSCPRSFLPGCWASSICNAHQLWRDICPLGPHAVMPCTMQQVCPGSAAWQWNVSCPALHAARETTCWGYRA